jgi:hypothetical protein
MLEGFSVGLNYSQHLQSEIKNLIAKNFEEIDNTLWLVLDTKQREVEIEELKNGFDYPYVDLVKN